MKIAIIGADGQLGTDLCKVIDKSERIPLTIADINITNLLACDKIIQKFKPDVVINTAAYHRVDDCEDNDVEAYRINAYGVKNLAIACRNNHSSLLHVSTDYVFDGEKKFPYTEEDVPKPKTAYGISKLAGEFFVRYILDRHFIIRTSGLYGVAGCLGKGGGNFVENMIKIAKTGQNIKVVTDEIITPTYTMHLARKIHQLIRTKHYGLYHMTNNGQCSWWEYAVKIFGLLKIDVKVDKTTASEFKTKANRPKYSVLENKNLKSLGMDDMPQWEDGLRDYLVEKRYLG